MWCLNKTVLGILLFLIVVGFCLLLTRFFRVKDGNSREDFTRARMRALGLTIQLVTAEKQVPPPPNREEFVAWLEGHVDAVELVFVIKDGMVCDLWGTPFMLSYPETHTFVITSCGKNLQYDCGERGGRSGAPSQPSGWTDSRGRISVGVHLNRHPRHKRSTAIG